MKNLFRLKERNTTVSREVVGGITTFLAMAYILAVNPSILSASGMNWNSVFTATALAAGIATLVMAFCANLPVALAPGMGCSWQFALTAVLLEGVLFIILSLFGIREAIIKSIPTSLKKAVSVGIGLFIAIIGLVNAGICSNDTKSIAEIDFKDPTEGIPAFITIIVMPFAYSISKGIAWGGSHILFVNSFQEN